MKKLTTMLGLLALCGGTMVAAPMVDTGVRTDLIVTGIKPEYKALLKQVAPVEGTIGDAYTRTFVDAGGNIWEATFQMYQETLNEMLNLADENGNPFHPTFEQLPYYCVNYTLTKLKPGDEEYAVYANFKMAWPSQYIYEQIWTWDGERTENNMIPEALREYQAASFEDVWNNPNRCRTFREDFAAGAADPVNGVYAYYTMVPNELIGNGAVYEGMDCYTYLVENDDTASEVKLNAFEAQEDGDYMDITNNIYFNLSGSPRRVRNSYKGLGEVQGIYPKETILPAFGDMHLFNTGTISPESYGDTNPWPTTDFPELSQLYAVIGDSYIEWSIDPAARAFDDTKVQASLKTLPDGETEFGHTTYVRAYLYADPKYGKDTSLNISAEDANFTQGPVERMVEEGQPDENWYALYTPAVGTMVPYLIADNTGNLEPWSGTYGARFAVSGQFQIVGNNPFNIGWEYKEGFVLNLENEFLHTYIAKSTGKLYYHYNPNNMQLFRELELVGGKDGVELVAVDNAQVIAANGVITVVAHEAGNVAVYGLDGACVKNVNVAAGETVSVDANKGIYVVTLNGKARKVIL